MKVVGFELEDWEHKIFDRTRDEHDLLLTVAILDNVLGAVAQTRYYFMGWRNVAGYKYVTKS